MKIIEDRGCGILNTAFEGTEKECLQWMEANTVAHPLNDSLAVSKELKENGNGELFTYDIPGKTVEVRDNGFGCFMPLDEAEEYCEKYPSAVIRDTPLTEECVEYYQWK